MTTQTPPPPTSPALVQALTRSVSIAAVRLINANMRLIGVRKEDHGAPLKLLQNLRVGGARSPDLPQGIRALVSLECKLAAPEEPPRDLAIVQCDFMLDYSVTDAEVFAQLGEGDLLAFAGASGLYNAWPYLREFVQSISSRMGLPSPMLLPTMPARQTQEIEEDDSDADQ